MRVLITIITIFVITTLINLDPIYAQACRPACPAGTHTCIAGYCVEKPVKDPSSTTTIPAEGALGYLISRAYQFIIPIVGILGFLFLMWSGFQFLTSKGDPKALEAAKARITYTIVGLILVALAYTISLVVQYMFSLRVPGGIPNI